MFGFARDFDSDFDSGWNGHSEWGTETYPEMDVRSPTSPLDLGPSLCLCRDHLDPLCRLCHGPGQSPSLGDGCSYPKSDRDPVPVPVHEDGDPGKVDVPDLDHRNDVRPVEGISPEKGSGA